MGLVVGTAVEPAPQTPGRLMLARCTHCESTFVTQQFGRQRCPKCGTDVLIEDPRPGVYAPPATMAEPPVDPAAPNGVPSPWERRAELGLVPALTQTIGAVMAAPGPFFSTLRWDVDDGGLRFFALVGAVPAVFDFIYQWIILRAVAGGGKSKEALTSLFEGVRGSIGNFDQMMEPLVKALDEATTGRALATGIIQRAVITILLVFAAAGVPHLVLSLFGAARAQWTGSLKATVYSATPLLLMLLPIPCCAQITALTWATGLQIFSFSKAHRISAGTATAAVIAFHMVALTCGCCISGLLGGGSGSSLEQLQHLQ